MSDVNKTEIDKLISYLNDNEYISLEDTKKALDYLGYKKSKPDQKCKELLLSVIRLINKRTDEVNSFIEVLNNNKLNYDEKRKLAFELMPFKDGNIAVEKLIIETVYDVKKYGKMEDLLVDLAYDDIEDVDELKLKIRQVINELKIDYDIDFNEVSMKMNDSVKCRKN